MLSWISHHPVGTAIIVLSHLLWIGAFALTYGRLRESMRVAGHRPTPIATAATGGDVVLEGKVATVSVLRSRLLNRPVAYFEWVVRSRPHDWSVESGKQKHKWVRHDGDRSTGAFVIEDGQGNRVMLLPEAATVFPKPGTTWYGPSPSPMDTRSIHPHIFSYTESILEDGDACTVCGRLQEPRPEDGPEVRGVISSGGGLPFAIAAGTPKAMLAAMRANAWMPAIHGAVLIVFAVLATFIVPELLGR